MAVNKAQVRMVVRGRVQGVFFRAATAQEARALGLDGWVRNLPDGAVEIRAEGTRRNLEMLLAWAHQGPPAAHVTDVEVEWVEYAGNWRDFEVQ